jgi:hypothetical protein
MNGSQPVAVELQNTCQQAWGSFREALVAAIAAVAEPYFRVRRFNDDAVWRERAYCYELYHQLRIKLRDNFPYILHGEIDKAGHEHVVRHFGNMRRPNPDFILHTPGHEDNLVVMEVKASDEGLSPIKKDLRKIKKFMRGVGYQHGVMLLFGSELRHEAKDFSRWRDVEVLWHGTVGQPPVTICKRSGT